MSEHLLEQSRAGFRYAVSSEQKLTELFQLACFTFCAGLAHILLLRARPTIQWFLDITRDIPKDVWGVYVLVLQKAGDKPCMYIGYSTAVDGGIRARIQQHSVGKLVPRFVQQAKTNGYSIVHICVLGHMSIPPPGHHEVSEFHPCSRGVGTSLPDISRKLRRMAIQLCIVVSPFTCLFPLRRRSRHSGSSFIVEACFLYILAYAAKGQVLWLP